MRQLTTSMGRMLRLPEFRPVALLIGAMIAAVVAATSVVLTVLYSTMMEENRSRLTEMLQHEAQLLDMTSAQSLSSGDSDDIIPELVRAHLSHQHFGATGEFTLARREDDRIVFVMQRRFEDQGAVSIPFDSPYAAPMRQALLGRTGTITGNDYRGEVVLAAYMPLPAIGAGLVAKIDLAEIRAPFVRATLLGAMATLLVIVVGTLAFLKIGGPLAGRLRASEQRFRTLVDLFPLGVHDLDRNGIIQFANPATHHLHAVPEGQLVGRSIVEFAPTPEERARLDTLLAELVLHQAEPVPFIGRIRRDDGVIRDIRVDWTYQMDDAGLVSGIVAIMRDTTEELRANHQLARYQANLEAVVEERTRELALSEKRFRAVAENANDAIVTTDRLGRIVYWNPKAEQLLGYRADEILGQSVNRVLSEDENPDPSVASAMATETVELMGRQRNGLPIPLEVSFAEWIDGGETFYTGILRDISDRKRAETEIRRAKARFEAVLDNIDATVYVVDIQSHEILYVNRRTQMAFGDVVGKTCWSALRGHTGGPCRLCVVPSLFDDEGRPSGVHVAVRYDETTGHWLECRDQAIYWTDGRLVMMEIATDITARKEHEAELEASNKRIAQQADELRLLAARLDASRRHAEEASRQAQAASHAKSTFLAAMSHELRTPLNSILGFSEVIRDQAFGPGQPERYREYAGDIHTSGRHLLDLINDILDLSKIEAGKLDLACEPLDIGGVLQDCRRLVRERALQHGIALHVALDPTLRQINADRRAVKQITLNLLSNALKFTDRGGAIVLRAESVAGGGAAIVVEDTGCGIPAEHLDRILEPFEQAENTYSRSRGGTGLGLTLVKALAELHGGSLEIASVVDQGTAVRVILPGPASEGEPPPPAATILTLDPTGRRRLRAKSAAVH